MITKFQYLGAFVGVVICAFIGFWAWQNAGGVEVDYDYEPRTPEEPSMPPDYRILTQDKVEEYKCPRCGAPVDFEDDQLRTKCEYCGSKLHRSVETVREEDD